LHIFDLMHVFFHCVQGYVQFAGYSFVGLTEFVQIHDSKSLTINNLLNNL
jgi:hypothetical protein